MNGIKVVGLLYVICMFLVTRPDLYIGNLNFDIFSWILTYDGHFLNLPPTGAFVYNNTSFWFFLQVSKEAVVEISDCYIELYPDLFGVQVC
jgi:hypothetical protein